MSMVDTDPPDDVCGFTLQPEDLDEKPDNVLNVETIEDRYESLEIGTCIREPWEGHDACIWHAEVDAKPLGALKLARADGPEHLNGAFLPGVELDYRISFVGCRLIRADLSGASLRGADLSGTDLREADLSEADLFIADLLGADLRKADLSGTDLGVADLSGASLRGVDLPGASLHGVDLSGASLYGVDLSGTDLRRADLSEADLGKADLSEADLRRADLSEADLVSADLSGANLRGTTLASVVLGHTGLTDIQLDHHTRFTHQSLYRLFRPLLGPHFRQIGFNADSWNTHARDAHQLAGQCSEAGLIGQARTLTLWDRRARRNESISTGGKINILIGIASWLNWQATGYGISISRLLRNMVLLFAVSTLTYLVYGINPENQAIPISTLLSQPFLSEPVASRLYFSVVTFTTAPPGPVTVVISRWVAMAETFLGTLLIVFLGFVLGNREQI